jgi:hypothetical protein
MLDPDGCALGGIRFNRHGYDLNRNWDSCDPTNAEHRAFMPEISAAKELMTTWLSQDKRMDVFVTLHNQERGGWLSEAESHAELARQLFATLQTESSCYLTEAGPRSSRGRPEPGRMGVYQYLDIVHKKPAMLLEQGVAFDKKLGHFPTAADRRTFGGEFIRVLAKIVTSP